jgi:RNA polymerase sigma factor (sigma-70 family)
LPRERANPSELSWSDARLVSECLEGNERAWTALIAKYKNLIYSVPVRWGLPPSDASDVFQSVVADMLSELGRLREPKALPLWLVQVASHRCIQLKKQQSRESQPDQGRHAGEPQSPSDQTPEELLQESMREQMLRDAVRETSPRCQQLIRMLFYETPARPYAEVAASLGLAVGSVGFIRRRCLERLRKVLQLAGFRFR